MVESFLERAKLDARFGLGKMTSFVKSVEHNGAFKGYFGGLSAANHLDHLQLCVNSGALLEVSALLRRTQMINERPHLNYAPDETEE